MEKKTTKQPTGSSRSKPPKAWLQYTGMASEMLAMLGLSVFAGYKLDHWCGWSLPVFLIIFPLGALALFLWRLIKATRNKDG